MVHPVPQIHAPLDSSLSANIQKEAFSGAESPLCKPVESSQNYNVFSKFLGRHREDVCRVLAQTGQARGVLRRRWSGRVG